MSKNSLRFASEEEFDAWKKDRGSSREAESQSRWTQERFKAVRDERDGVPFDSQHEARVFDELELERQSGQYAIVLLQVPVLLPGTLDSGTRERMRIDFVAIEPWAMQGVHFIDAKKRPTEQWLTKKRTAEAVHDIEIKTR